MSENFINVIRIQNMSEMTDFQRIEHNLRTLIVSHEGTIPGSRGFGMSGVPTDLLPSESRNAFHSELDEKVEEYIPEIALADVAIDSHKEGRLGLIVYVEASDEDAEVVFLND